jgi:molybdopterin molybdotransferase
MGLVATLDFEQARASVLSRLCANRPPLIAEEVDLLEAAGRVLAETVPADRDYPPTDRSVRDGFAIRAADVPGTLELSGEIRAGQKSDLVLQPGQAIEIMTGAAVPPGADAVVMIEHTSVAGHRVVIERTLSHRENINPCGSEMRAGQTVLQPGARLGYAEVALLATLGRRRLRVYAKPKVAIIATGDELTGIEEAPLAHQIRNSNAYSLAVQVQRAGGRPVILGVAKDEYDSTFDLIQRGLASDLLLLSGGVSAGRYDIVEKVLADLGAEFFFDRVRIQPGQPLVFGAVQGKFFFGLPGNPVSTMVTFELFGRAAVELLGGQTESMLPLTWSRLSQEFHQKTGLTRFLPARLNSDGSCVTPLEWQGSGDIAGLTRANAFLVTEAGRENWAESDLIRVLLK